MYVLFFFKRKLTKAQHVAGIFMARSPKLEAFASILEKKANILSPHSWTGMKN